MTSETGEPLVFRPTKVTPAWREFGMVIKAARMASNAGHYADFLNFGSEYLAYMEEGRIGPPTDAKVIEMAQLLALDHLELLEVAHYARDQQSQRAMLSIEDFKIHEDIAHRFEK